MTDRQDILWKIEAQRRTIREHIPKYYNDPPNHRNFALRTIQIAQDQIRHLKSRANFSVGYDPIDDWRP